MKYLARALALLALASLAYAQDPVGNCDIAQGQPTPPLVTSNGLFSCVPKTVGATGIGAGAWTKIGPGAGGAPSGSAGGDLGGTYPNPTVVRGADLTSGSAIVGQKFFGAGVPGSVAGNLPGDIYSDTTNHSAYWCNATAGTAAPACTSVASGQWTLLNGGGGGSGTVTSVGLTLPNIFNVAGSPVTASGSITGTFVNQLTSLVFASPNGSTGAPSFRSLVFADLPVLGGTCTVSATTGTITLDGAGSGCSVAGANKTKFKLGPITGAVTLASPTNLQDGTSYEFQVTQNGTTAQTFNVPAWLNNAASLPNDLSAVIVYRGIWDAGAGAIVQPSAIVNTNGYCATTSDSTVNPAASFIKTWCDGTFGFSSRDSSGNLRHQVKFASGKDLTVNNTVTLSGTDGTTMTLPATSQTIPGLSQTNTWTGTNDFSAGITKLGPSAPVQQASDFICDTNATTGGYACITAVGVTETYFTNAVATIATAATANTIDGTHASLQTNTLFDVVGNASTTVTLKLNACSAFSGGVCTGRVILWQSGALAGASGTNAGTVICDIFGTSVATTFFTGCVSRITQPGLLSAQSTTVPNTSTNWVIVWSVTFGAAANQAVVMAQLGNKKRWDY